jgi:predicted mannosyl-3-phosphoglycerate phosphatase (HAD superfamily)
MKNPLQELYDLVKKEFPVTIISDRAGNITSVEYEKTWKVGGTTPVLDESGAVIDYKEDYEERSLTSSDIKAIETWIKDNVVSS